jgi:hypothetical protein
MKCSEYATLGVYRNIMMPAKKSDFRRKKKGKTTEKYTVENPSAENNQGKMNNRTFQNEFIENTSSRV